MNETECKTELELPPIHVTMEDVEACRKRRFDGHFFISPGAGATAGATGVPSSSPGPT